MAAEIAEVKKRGRYEWRLNRSDKWAWFEDSKQITGAYPGYEDADYAFKVHCLKEGREAVKLPEPSIKAHPQYKRLEQVYGCLTVEQLDDRVARLNCEIAGHQKVARREFNGNGGRRSGAAISAQAARDIAAEKMLLELYRNEKFLLNLAR